MLLLVCFHVWRAVLISQYTVLMMISFHLEDFWDNALVPAMAGELLKQTADSPAESRDHPEEQKHRRCFICSGSSRCRSTMVPVFLFSLFKLPQAGLFLRCVMPPRLTNLSSLVIVHHWKAESSKPGNQRGQNLKSHLRGHRVSRNALLTLVFWLED